MDEHSIAIATASLPGFELTDALGVARRLGFDAVCFLGAAGARHSGGLLPGFFWDELDGPARARIRAAYAPFRRGLIHAPFHDLPLISTNPYVEREAVRQVAMAIDAAGALGLDVVTVHAAPAGRIPPEEFGARLKATLRLLGDSAAAAGCRIGIENVAYPCDPDEHADLLDAVDHPNVGATLDVGHVAMWFKRDGIFGLPGDSAAQLYNNRLLDLLDRLGDRIVNVHVHDVRADDLRDHRAVGRGIVDFRAVIQRLRRYGYQGLLELELEEPDIVEAATESWAYLAQILSELPSSVGQAPST